jgi:uncharacterized protein (TIGR02996 family)
MSDAAFLAAIQDAPDDDTLKLVYADWLDEHGDEEGRGRAELIRLQCELERLPPKDRKRPGLEKQIRRVLRTHGKHWTKPLRDAKLGKDWSFRRGFVDGVTMSATGFVNVAEQIFRLAPTIRSGRFPDASNEVNALADCPHLARLRELDLRRMCVCGYCAIDRELRKLAASPHVSNLTLLRLAEDRVDDELASHVAASRHLGRLLTLDLSDNRIGADGVRALLSSRHLTSLTTLDLSWNRLRTAGIRPLAEKTKLKSLTTLVLSGNVISSVGARILAGSPVLAQLTTLDLSSNVLGPGGARALAASPHLEGVTMLDVSHSSIGTEGAKALRARFGKRVRV